MALKDKRDRDRGGKSRGSGFKYKERDSESVRKRAEQQGGKFDSILKSGFDAWRPADGENVIRILPPTWDDHDHYGYDVWVHSFVGPDKSTYLCPQKMLNKPCPICAASREAKAAGEEEDAKQLSATRRVAVWILDRDSDRPTPSLWTMSWSQDRDIASLCQNKRTGKVLLIDHPNHGYDVMFNKTGKGLNTRYVGLAVDREETAALEDEDELESVLEYIQENPIPSVLNFYDAAYLKKNVIDGTVEEKDKDLDDDDPDAEDADSRGSRDRKSDRRPSRRDKGDADAETEEDAEEVDDRRGSKDRDRKPSRRDEPDDEDAEEPADYEEDEDSDSGKDDRRGSRDRDRGRSDRKPSRRDEPDDEDAEEPADEEDAEEVDDRRGSKDRGRDRPTSRRR